MAIEDMADGRERGFFFFFFSPFFLSYLPPRGWPEDGGKRDQSMEEIEAPGSFFFSFPLFPPPPPSLYPFPPINCSRSAVRPTP